VKQQLKDYIIGFPHLNSTIKNLIDLGVNSKNRWFEGYYDNNVEESDKT
jgi:hypothetical protein